MFPNVPSGPSSVFAANTASAGGSFLSLLDLTSSGLNNNVSSETAPVTRALKNNEAVSALLANIAAVPGAPIQGHTLPLKLSFNIFGAQNRMPAMVHQTGQADAPELQKVAPPSADQSAPGVFSNLTPAVPQAANTVPDPTASLQKSPDAPAPDESSNRDGAPAGSSTHAPKVAAMAPAAAVVAKVTAAALPAVTSRHAAAPAAAVNQKAARTRFSSADPVPATGQPATTMPAVVIPAATSPVAVPPPTPTKAVEAAPADLKTPLVPNASEPRVSEAQASLTIADDATPRSAPPARLAFALRVQTPAVTAAAAPVSATPQIPSSLRIHTEPAVAIPAPHGTVPAMTADPELKPAPSPENELPGRPPSATEQPTSLPNRPPDATPAPHIAVAEARPGQNSSANSGSGSKGGDPARENARNTDPKAEPVSAGPAPAAASQNFYIPAASVPSAPLTSGAPSHATQQSAGTVLMPAHEAPKTGPANQISITLPAGDQQNVQVRLTDRGGEIRVSVHAPNEELVGTLRQDLGSLTSKLNQSGFSTEAFTPSAGESLPRDRQNPDLRQQNHENSDRQTPEHSPRQENPQQNGHGKRPAWMDDFENSMAN
jgi:hypothetical protein